MRSSVPDGDLAAIIEHDRRCTERDQLEFHHRRLTRPMLAPPLNDAQFWRQYTRLPLIKVTRRRFGTHVDGRPNASRAREPAPVTVVFDLRTPAGETD